MDAPAEIQRLLHESGAQLKRQHRNCVYLLPNGQTFAVSPHASYRGQKNNLALLKKLLGIVPERSKHDRRPRKNRNRHHHKPLYVNPDIPDLPTFRQKLRTALNLAPPRLDGFGSRPPGVKLEPAVSGHEVSRTHVRVQRLEDIETSAPRPRSAIQHRALGQSSPARVMSPEMIARANLVMHEGGQQAYDNFIRLWRQGQIPDEQPQEKLAMAQQNPLVSSIPGLLKLLETAETQKTALFCEVQTLQQQITEHQQQVSDRQAQIKKLDDFIDSAKLTLDQLPQIEPALLRAGINIVPMADDKNGKRSPALRGDAIIADAIALLQKSTDGMITGVVTVSEVKNHIAKHAPEIRYETVFAALRNESKRDNKRIVFLGNARYSLPEPKTVRQRPNGKPATKTGIAANA